MKKLTLLLVVQHLKKQLILKNLLLVLVLSLLVSCSSENETPADTTPPIITLLGDATIMITLGTTYVDEGATAQDDIDGDISASITVSNPVDENILGTYTVTYNVSDSSGNSASASRTVDVVPVPDTTPPIITLLGDATVTIILGTTYTDDGATAEDNFDGDISASITVSNPVDVTILGTYTVTYNVSDSSGNSASASRIVDVVPDTTPPIITLLGDATITITLGTTYTDEGATAEDNIDGDISASITVSNPVDENILGTYTVTYNVSDASGNSASASRTVHVVPAASTTVTIGFYLFYDFETETICTGFDCDLFPPANFDLNIRWIDNSTVKARMLWNESDTDMAYVVDKSFDELLLLDVSNYYFCTNINDSNSACLNPSTTEPTTFVGLFYTDEGNYYAAEYISEEGGISGNVTFRFKLLE